MVAFYMLTTLRRVLGPRSYEFGGTVAPNESMLRMQRTSIRTEPRRNCDSRTTQY